MAAHKFNSPIVKVIEENKRKNTRNWMFWIFKSTRKNFM